MTEKQIDGEEQIVKAVSAAAFVAHEVNRAYCAFLGDHSQEPWADVPQWQRESCCQGVTDIMREPNITPQQQHSLWMALKKQQGWTYGKEKDEEKKTHPCMVPFVDLPEEQQVKDYLFHAAVKSVLGLFLP